MRFLLLDDGIDMLTRELRLMANSQHCRPRWIAYEPTLEEHGNTVCVLYTGEPNSPRSTEPELFRAFDNTADRLLHTTMERVQTDVMYGRLAYHYCFSHTRLGCHGWDRCYIV
jgi:hypothetical protein